MTPYPQRQGCLLRQSLTRSQPRLHFCRGYSTIKDFVSKNKQSRECIWSFAYDMVSALDRNKGIDFLYMLSRAEVPMLSEQKLAKIAKQAGITVVPPPKLSKPVTCENLDRKWLLRLVHDAVPECVLRQRYPELQERDQLLGLVWTGRLSVRNKAMTVLARRSGVRTAVICDFLNIDKHSCRKYCKSFDDGGVAGLLSRKVLAHARARTGKSRKPYLPFFMNPLRRQATTVHLGGWLTSLPRSLHKEAQHVLT